MATGRAEGSGWPCAPASSPTTAGRSGSSPLTTSAAVSVSRSPSSVTRVSEQRTEPRPTDSDTGGPGDVAHYARKGDIAGAAVEGGLVTALCGVKFQPVRDPQRFPVCRPCARLIEQLDNR